MIMAEHNMDKRTLRIMINDQIDAIMAQCGALRAGDVTSRAAAVKLIATNVEVLQAWEAMLTEMEGR